MSKIPIISKVYVWSVVLEPLLFFVIWDEWTTGIGGNLSRILQSLVVIALILKYLIKPSGLRIINLANPLYRNYGIYLGVVIFAGLVGATFGVYNVPMMFSSSKQSYFANLLNSQFVRPLFEYFIAIYYFVYFMVLPRYMLKTERALQYFFSVFSTMFIVSFVLGVIGFAFEYFGVRLLPCHIANWPQWAGPRFHGLAGEPRHAFIYLFLGLSVLHLESHIKGRSLNNMWIVAIITVAFLTQSASGLIGIAIFMGLFFIYGITQVMTLRHGFYFLAILTLSTGLIYVAISSSERIFMYLRSMSDLWNILESGGELPHPIILQCNEIYPLYDLVVKARELNILPIIIGSGLGSASVINNYYTHLTEGQMMNPNSQLVRSLFESGIVGTFFFIMSFLYPVKQLSKDTAKKDRFTFITLTLLLISCFFGIRSAAPFIYLGIFIAVFAPFYKINRETV